MSIAGPIEAVNIFGREFGVLQDAESNRKLGGRENELLMLGNGSAIIKQTRVGWSTDGLQVEIDDDRDDQEYLQDIADAGTLGTIGITYASGVTYSGRGIVGGELQVSSASQTASLTLIGTGKLAQQ